MRDENLLLKTLLWRGTERYTAGWTAVARGAVSFAGEFCEATFIYFPKPVIEALLSASSRRFFVWNAQSSTATFLYPAMVSAIVDAAASFHLN